MRVIEMTEHGGPETLQLAERPDAVPGPGQILVKVAAATVNPVDWFTRAGYLAAIMTHLTPPFVFGWDLAGTVTAVGDRVDPGVAARLTPGTRVAGMTPWFDAGVGTYAELVAADPSWLAVIPGGVDDVTAAAVPLNALTARQALDLLDLQPGQTVLITGASGAVGGFAVQLARRAGATVIAAASLGDREFVAGLGAAHVVERRPDADLSASVRAALGGDGVDRVLDAGMAGPSVITAVKDGGAVVSVRDSAMPEPERGITVRKVSVVPDGAQLQTLLESVAAGTLITRVAGTVALAEAAEAHRRAEAGVRGKLVLTLGAPA